MVLFAIAITLLSCILEVKGDPACFFTETNYQGSMVCGHGNVNLLSGQYNDAFKSVRVVAGEQVALFNDDAFHGDGALIEEDVPDLSSIGISALSSYIAFQPVCFFTEMGYYGDVHCYTTRTILPSGLQKKFKSVKIPEGLQVIVYTGNYQDYATVLESGDIPDLDTTSIGADSIVSLMVLSAYI